MSAVSKPDKLEDWTIDILNELIKFTDVESETLDFKKIHDNLNEHLCSMANTNGGFLVLGVNEVKSDDGKKIIRFEKIGYNRGEEDNTKNTIGNNAFNIDPPPQIKILNIPDGEKFYPVIEIKNEVSKKPFFIKDRGQCFVRIDNSSRPASRSTVLRLFSSSIEQRKSVEMLKVAVILVKEALLFSSQNINQNRLPYNTQSKIAPIDLTILRTAILSAEWFLTEKDLLGVHSDTGTFSHGINGVLYNVGLLNEYIGSYNRETNPQELEKISKWLSSWQSGMTHTSYDIQILDKIALEADNFLKKYD